MPILASAAAAANDDLQLLLLDLSHAHLREANEFASTIDLALTISGVGGELSLRRLMRRARVTQLRCKADSFHQRLFLYKTFLSNFHFRRRATNLVAARAPFARCGPNPVVSGEFSGAFAFRFRRRTVARAKVTRTIVGVEVATGHSGWLWRVVGVDECDYDS